MADKNTFQIKALTVSIMGDFTEQARFI